MYVIIFRMLLLNIFPFLLLSHFFFPLWFRVFQSIRERALDLTGRNFIAGCALHLLLLKGTWRCLEAARGAVEDAVTSTVRYVRALWNKLYLQNCLQAFLQRKAIRKLQSRPRSKRILSSHLLPGLL